MSSIKIVFGERLKALRNEKQKTLRELAENLNIPYSTLANYERGEREPSYENLVTIADFFGVTTDYLIGRSDFKTPEEEYLRDLIKRNLDVKHHVDNDEFILFLIELFKSMVTIYEFDNFLSDSFLAAIKEIKIYYEKLISLKDDCKNLIYKSLEKYKNIKTKIKHFHPSKYHSKIYLTIAQNTELNSISNNINNILKKSILIFSNEISNIVRRELDQLLKPKENPEILFLNSVKLISSHYSKEGIIKIIENAIINSIVEIFKNNYKKYGIKGKYKIKIKNQSDIK